MKRSIFVLLVVFLVSCQEDEVSPTQAQVTAKKLVSDLHISFDVIATNYSVSVSDFETASPFFVGSSLKITSDGFAEVANEQSSSAVFNLEFLQSYQVSGSNVFLYF